jgi:tetratricopeptide (TPR) repeat protein
MADDTRIEDLRRRVRLIPTSLAFAELADELRRARRFLEAVSVCRTGLEIYPGFLAARVTLGRCFIDLNRLDDAEAELAKVREVAPENAIANRALAVIRERRHAVVGETAEDKGSERAVEGPDATYDGATFEIRLSRTPIPRPPTPRPTPGEASSGRAVEAPAAAHEGPWAEVQHMPDATYRGDTVRTLAALDAWLDAIHVTRASRTT